MAKLEVDTVIRAQGQIDAKDRNGEIGPEAKIKAEVVEIISDEVLENYKATGTRLAMPWIDKTSTEEPWKRWRKKSGQEHIEAPKVLKSAPIDPRKQKLFLLVKSLEDTELLTKIRKLGDEYMGMQDVILVVVENGEKKALKMPFRIDICSDLLDELESLLGKASVKVV